MRGSGTPRKASALEATSFAAARPTSCISRGRVTYLPMLGHFLTNCSVSASVDFSLSVSKQFFVETPSRRNRRSSRVLGRSGRATAPRGSFTGKIGPDRLPSGRAKGSPRRLDKYCTWIRRVSRTRLLVAMLVHSSHGYHVNIMPCQSRSASRSADKQFKEPLRKRLAAAARVPRLPSGVRTRKLTYIALAL